MRSIMTAQEKLLKAPGRTAPKERMAKLIVVDADESDEQGRLAWMESHMAPYVTKTPEKAQPPKPR